MLISKWSIYYNNQSDYVEKKIRISKLYEKVLDIAKKEKRPRDWFYYRDLLNDIRRLEDDCSDLLEEIQLFRNRKYYNVYSEEE